MKLYTYWRSSAAYRVRIGLELKGLAREDVAVDLQKGEQNSPAYRKRNPQGLLPLLEDGETRSASRSPSSSTWTSATPSRRCCPKSRRCARACASWRC